jgi:hypothetical protein
VKRARPEAEIQRAVVTALRWALPAEAIVHHSAHEFGRGGAEGRQRQAILQGMGVHAGFADLVVLAAGRVVFLEVKAARGRLSPHQRAFGEAVQAQGHAWAVVRSVQEAVDAVAAAGVPVRVRRTASGAPAGAGAR